LWRTTKPIRIIAEGSYYFGDQGSSRTFDISPDGKRFLMVKGSAADEASPLHNVIIVQNWTEELKRLVPRN
jgi:hypothetical protein